MRASAYHFERRMLFANAIVRGSLPGCSSTVPLVTPLTARDTPSTRVMSLVVGAFFGVARYRDLRGDAEDRA